MTVNDGVDRKIPSYMRDMGSVGRRSNGSLKIVADHSINNMTASMHNYGSGQDGFKVYERRHIGVDDFLDGGLTDNKFYEKFLTDLSDIETINNRVEREVQFRIQQRINKFGKDGKRILGIHIAVPVEHELAPFERYSQANFERETKIKQDLFHTKHLIDSNLHN